MALLFSYGTLQEEQVQFKLFGRKLTGRKDFLLGYKLETAPVADPQFVRTSGKTHHAILRQSDTATQIPGSVFEVTDAELLHADKYEPVEYKRVLATLASGRKTWVYVSAC